MNPRKNKKAADSTDASRTELQRCQHELEECQKLAKETQALLSNEIAERRISEEKLTQLNADLSLQAAELKELNKTLLDSEQRLRIAVETGKIGLFVWDSTNVKNPGDWSNQLKEIFGLPLDAAVTHDMFLKCVHPDDRVHIDQCVQRALKGENKGEYRTEYRTIKPDDGLEHWVVARGQAFFNDEGQAIRFIGTVMDITERKRAEQSLSRLNVELEERISQRIAELAQANKALQSEVAERKRAEEQLRQSQAYLAEAQRLSQTGSFGWDVSTGDLVWSDQTFCIVGYSRNIKPTLELALKRVHPEDIALVRQTLDNAARERANLDFEHRLLMPDGMVKYIHVLAQPVKTETDSVKFVGALMDITDRKLAEEALRRNEAYLAEAQKLSRTGSFCIRVASQELICSEETVRIGGWESGTIPTLEQSLERVHPDDRQRVQTVLEKALQEGSFLEYEHRLLLPDGSIRHVHTVANSIRDASGQVEFVGAVMDITERKKAAEALRASEHLARGQLDALIRTLDSLANESDPANLPKHVVKTIHSQLGAHSVTIWERNGEALDFLGAIEGGRFQTRSEAHYFEGSIPVTGHAPPLWVEALRTGMHTLIEDIDKEPCRIILSDGRSAEWHAADLTRPFTHLKVHFAEQNIRGLLISPMMLAGRLEGIIGIRFTGTRVFGQAEIDLMKALAHQAMLAMRLTHLSAQSRQAAVMAERNRLARDIHDTLAQGFTGVIMQLEAAKGAAARNELSVAAAHIGRADDLARLSLGEARRSVRALRPRSLREGNLCVALEDLLKRMSEGTKLRAEFLSDGDERVLPRDREEGLLRIAQESLTNTIKHANAANFRATLHFGLETLQLQLADDGLGFDPQTESEGFGLIGMKERVDQLGGQFILRSKPGQGTEILVILNSPATLKPGNGND